MDRSTFRVIAGASTRKTVLGSNPGGWPDGDQLAARVLWEGRREVHYLEVPLFDEPLAVKTPPGYRLDTREVVEPPFRLVIYTFRASSELES